MDSDVSDATPQDLEGSDDLPINGSPAVSNVIPLPPRKQIHSSGTIVNNRAYEGSPGSDGGSKQGGIFHGAKIPPHTSPRVRIPSHGSPDSHRMDACGSPLSSQTDYDSESIDSRRVRRISDDRPKLDKSHSSPAYDFNETDDSAFFERFVFIKFFLILILSLNID